MWIRPNLGLFVGLANANNDRDKTDSKNTSGGLVLGDFAVQLGGLLGGVLGFGERWGFYTGLSGAIALLPFLGFGFIGIPIGIHWKKKWGLGLIIPVFVSSWWVGLLVGVGAFGLAYLLSRRSQQ